MSSFIASFGEDRVESLYDMHASDMAKMTVDSPDGSLPLSDRDIIAHLDPVAHPSGDVKVYALILDQDIPKIPEEVFAAIMAPDLEASELMSRRDVVDWVSEHPSYDVMLRGQPESGRKALYIDTESESYDTLLDCLQMIDARMAYPRDEANLLSADTVLPEPLAFTGFTDTYRAYAALDKIHEMIDTAPAKDAVREQDAQFDVTL